MSWDEGDLNGRFFYKDSLYSSFLLLFGGGGPTWSEIHGNLSMNWFRDTHSGKLRSH